MKVTLYKNCRLSNSYQEVYDCTKRNINGKESSFFEEYLNTLQSFDYIELDTVYSTFGGTLNFDMTINDANIYDYNYLKIEHNNIVRYCFVDRITIRNDIAKIEYSEDIWHNYSNDIKLNKSLLCNTYHNLEKYKNLQYEKVMPFDYATKNIEQRLSNVIPDLGNIDYYIFVKIQVYNLTKTADLENISDRNYYTCFIRERQKVETNHKIKYGFYESIDIINKIIKNITNYKYNSLYIDIINTYIIPTYFLKDTDFKDDFYVANNYIMNIDDVYYEFSNLAYGLYRTTNVGGFYKIGCSKEIIPTYKDFSIGTQSTKIKIKRNGLPFDMKILFSCTDFGFNLFLSCQDKIEDITDDFMIETPISYIDSQNYQLDRLNRSLLKNDYSKALMKNVFSWGGVIGNIVSLAMAPQATGAMLGNTISSIEQPLSSIVDTIKISEKLDNESYSTLTKNLTKNANIVNIYYGINIWTIIPEDEETKNMLLTRTGYAVNLMVDNIEIANEVLNSNEKIKYNAIRFSKINIYGKFTQEIKNALESILLNGTIINYKGE